MFKPYHVRHEQLAHQAAHAAMLSDWQREEWTRQQKLKMERRKILIVGALLLIRLLLEIPLHIRVIVLIPLLIVLLIGDLCRDLDIAQEGHHHD